ncbi:hypothetical protein L6R29_21050 [Myxococcota bacterium]|nr:hypothetical protein [Myxococcota bacterium]
MRSANRNNNAPTNRNNNLGFRLLSFSNIFDVRPLRRPRQQV